jgi:hypothetical protein
MPELQNAGYCNTELKSIDVAAGVDVTLNIHLMLKTTHTPA